MSMTVQQAIDATYLRATRKATGLSITSTKGTQILALLDFFQKDWNNDSTTDWRTLRQIFTLTPLVTATDTFTIADLSTLNRISRIQGDYVRITTATQEWDYTIVDPGSLYNDGPTLNSSGRAIGRSYGTCAVVGTNLVFDRAFTSTSAQIGGTIKLPGIKNVTTLTAATDVLQVDDPQWLIVRCAAEYCFNDVTRVNLFPQLKDEADAKYQEMRSNNDGQVETAYTPDIGLIGQTWS